MTKTQCLKLIKEVADKYSLPMEFLNKLDEILTPKRGGVKKPLNEITKDFDGEVYLKCNISGLYAPATPDYFYTSQNLGLDINGHKLLRSSKEADKLKKRVMRARKAQEKKILDGVISDEITPEEAKILVKKLKEEPIDFTPLLDKGFII